MTKQAFVLVVYEHELLGEGLATRLHALGVEARSVPSGRVGALRAGLRSHPDVVVVESTNEQCLDRIRRLSPTSRVVNVTASIGRGCPTEEVRFDVILEALREEPPTPAPA